MKIIHFGDIHIWRMKMAWNDLLYPKRYLGGANLLLNRRAKFPPAVGEQVVADILKQDADLVVFSGDMTTASHPEEFQACAELFAPLREKWGEKFFVIPGNHDRYTVKSTKQDWYAKAFPYGEIDGVRSLELDDDYVVVGLDSSRAFMLRSNGYFSAELEQKLDAELQKHVGKKVILVGHYPVDYPESVVIEPQHELIRREHLKLLLDKHKPVLYLHGHKHIRWRLGNAVNCGSAGMISSDPLKQAGYVSIELNGKIQQINASSLGEVRGEFLLRKL